MSKTYRYQKALFLLIVLCSGLGVFLGIANDDWSFNGLGYFTNQSNLLVFMVYGYLIFNKENLNQFQLTLVYQAVLAIVLTGFVYHIILAPTIDSNDGFSLVNFLVHTATPLLVVIERIGFSRKQVLHRWHPIYWLSFPFVYFIFTLVFRWLGGRFGAGTDYESQYPYFFLNFGEYGVGYFLIVLVIALAMGYGIVYLNHFSFRKEKSGE